MSARRRDRPAAIAADVRHRPWKQPRLPWMMFQSWRNVLFMHWPVPARELRSLVPSPLDIDEFGGSAWVGLTPLEVHGLRMRWLPPFPGARVFPEMSLRTYVRHRGKPGVFFFTLDTTNRLAVVAAHLFRGLPYRPATMKVEHTSELTRYEARGARSEFLATYHPAGHENEASPGTLDHFLLERYALYSMLESRRVLRADIHHRPWRYRSVVVDVQRNTVPGAYGIHVPAVPTQVHHAARQDTLIWPLVPSRMEHRRLIPVYG